MESGSRRGTFQIPLALKKWRFSYHNKNTAILFSQPVCAPPWCE
jgi:hypothetical protein